MVRACCMSLVTGIMDNPRTIDADRISTKENIAVARKVAEESFVLLKNEGNQLPLDRTKVRKGAVIGPNGDFGQHFRLGAKSYQLLQGGGSATVAPPAHRIITPYAGMRNIAGEQVEVLFEPGCLAEHGTVSISSKFLRTKNGSEGLDATYYENKNYKGKTRSSIDKALNFIWMRTPVIIEEGARGKSKNFSARWTNTIPQSRNYTFELEAIGV